MAQKNKGYNDYTKPELEDKLRQMEEELFNLRFQARIAKLDKPHRIGAVRRDIARAKTFLRQLELNQKAPAGEESAK